MNQRSRSRRIRFTALLKWGVSVLFLLVLFSAVSSGDIGRLFSDPAWVMTGLSCAITVAMIGVSCWKWQFILRRTWPAVRYLYLIRVYLIGYFFSNLLPSVVGGDVVRAAYVGRRSGDLAGSAVSVFVERFTGVLVLLFLAVAAPLLRPAVYGSIYVRGAALLSCLLLAGLLMGAICRVSPGSLPAGFLRRIWEMAWRLGAAILSPAWPRGKAICETARHEVEIKLEKFFSKLGATIDWLARDRRVLATVILQTAAFYFITWCNVYVALRVFRVEVPFLDLCALVPAIMLVAMIPISQASIGLAEGCYVVYLGVLGISREEALAAALLLRAKFLLVGLIGFAIYHAHRNEVSLDGTESAD